MILSITLLLFAVVLSPCYHVKGQFWEEITLEAGEETALDLDGDPDCTICGLSGHSSAALSKVINGVAVRPLNKYPWIVPLLNVGSNLLKCGGAVISQYFVLTAGHCVSRNKGPHTLKVGIMRKSTTVPDQILEVEEIIVHPNFSTEVFNDDIALLKLKEPLRCDKHTRPICIPQKKMDRMGKTVIVAGYGRNDQHVDIHGHPQRLREGRVRQVDPILCQMATSRQKNKDRIFCTMGILNQTSCQGDSGSSVFGDFDGVFYSLGVTSIHTDAKLCPIRGPVTFTNTYAYRHWIKSHVKHLPSPPKPFY